MPKPVHPDLVRAIRRNYARGDTIAVLSAETSLSRSCVSGIVNGRTHQRVLVDDSLGIAAEVNALPARALPPQAQANKAARWERFLKRGI